MDNIKVCDYIPEEATPGKLIGLVNMLADEVAHWRELSSRYEAELAEKKKNYKLRLAKAKVLYLDKGNATIVNAFAESDPLTIAAANEMTEVESKMILAQGKYDGVLAQYQALKVSINLKQEELKTFRG